MKRPSYFRGYCSLFVGIVLPALCIGADEAAAPEVEAQAQAAARRIWLVLEAVLDHHTAPPTRQQMLQMGLRRLSQRQPNEEELDRRFARSISELSRQTEIEDFLASQLVIACQARNLPIVQLESALVYSAFQAVPGGATYTPAKEAAVQQQLLENRYVGIGIAMGMKDDYPSMFQVFPRGPAQRGGAQAGDIMLSIDGQDTKGMSLETVIPKLRGQAGVPVSIVVRQLNSQDVRTLTIMRGEVPIETVVGRERNSEQEWNYGVPDAKEIAYLKITSIRGSTVSELRETARKLHSQGFRAAILDLRKMESGELRHAAMIADLLLEDGPIGTAVVRGRREEFTSNADNLFPGWPIAVLIDVTTVRQAEWIAASLQQRRNTMLIGSDTSGAGFVMERVKLADGATIELRTGVFYRADGRSLVSENVSFVHTTLRRVIQNLPRRAGREIVEPPAVWNGITPDLAVTGDLVKSATAKLQEQLAGKPDDSSD